MLKLLGNFINQLKQIERILKFDKPTDEILHTIKNIFSDKQKEHYFYNNLKNINWLEPLHQNGFFSPEYLLDDSYWNQSEYLEYLSVQIKEGEIDEAYSGANPFLEVEAFKPSSLERFFVYNSFKAPRNFNSTARLVG
ncbi:hypothetical protein [Gelidibacter mesophilus]|uniref:hypothetical protein n=1 Tax=Gelidibacter mesophilus TaxID=169050 RepID=UPI00040282CF|nr:hypothetical protein [Gelidibacter mesophilus]